MKFSHKITYYLLILFKTLLSSISKRSRSKLAFQIASILYHNLQLRRDLASENIKKAFPYWSDVKVNLTLRKTYLFFTQNLIEFISVPKSWDGIVVNIKGEEVLEEAIEECKGVILISGHFGCWEILGKWVGEKVPLFTGVAQRQKNRGADKFFQEQREIPGTGHIFRKEPIEKMYDVLNRNGVLGLVSDQDAKKRGVFTDFFGYPASTPKGAALFHIRTSAPMLVGVCIKRGFMNYEIEFLKVNTSSQDIGDITQQYTSTLEKCIRSNPEQYFWFHRRWKTRP